MSAANLWLDTGPPGRSASRITSPGKREKHHLAGDQTSHAINTRKGRHRQLDRFRRPWVAVWTGASGRSYGNGVLRGGWHDLLHR